MNKELFLETLAKNNIACSSETYDELVLFMKKTLEVNEQFNLTAIKDEDSFMEKMILDSSLASLPFDFSNKKIIDVGTGAGFPGLVLYILNKNIHMTLLDSTAKKINHLKNYCLEKKYDVKTICDRAENYSRAHNEEYDFATARAVAHLSILLELIIPLLKVNGYFIALKGPGVEEEIKESEKAFKKLGCVLENNISYSLPSGEKRNLVIVKKLSKTNKKYPRTYDQIKKLPL